jgi:hypothetical protein
VELYTIFVEDKRGFDDSFFIDIIDGHARRAEARARQSANEDGWHLEHIKTTALLTIEHWRGLSVSENLRDEYMERMMKFESWLNNA